MLPLNDSHSMEHEIDVRHEIDSGLADSAAGRTTPVEEVRRRFGLEPDDDLPPDPAPVG